MCAWRSPANLREMTMKQKKFVLYPVLAIALVLACLGLGGCVDDEPDEPANYPVAGIWHAVAAWQEENNVKLGGYTYHIVNDYQIDFYFDFREDGAILKKTISHMNGNLVPTDNDEWNIFNETWTVKGNVLTLSSGKRYVIVDDEFDDVFPSKNILLRYKKQAPAVDNDQGDAQGKSAILQGTTTVL